MRLLISTCRHVLPTSLSFKYLGVVTLGAALVCASNGRSWGQTAEGETASALQAAEKASIPADSERVAARKTIHELFRKQFDSRAAVERRGLVQRLMDEAADTTDDGAARYELLVQAAEVAISIDDVPLADEALRRIDARYAIDLLKMKRYVVASVGPKVRSRDGAQELGRYATELVEEHLADDDFPGAIDVLDSALAGARRAKETSLSRKLLLLKKSTSDVAKRYHAAQAALAVLEQKPQDSAANATVGEYLCFVKRNFERGVPYLALGSDAALKGVALLEMAELQDFGAQLKLGDAWWDAATERSEPDTGKMRGRAAEWYRTALPKLSGLTKTRVEARLAEADSLSDEESPVPRLSALEQQTVRRAMAHRWQPIMKINKNRLKAVRFAADGELVIDDEPVPQYRWRVDGSVIYLVLTADPTILHGNYYFSKDGKFLTRMIRDGKIVDEGYMQPE